MQISVFDEPSVIVDRAEIAVGGIRKDCHDAGLPLDFPRQSERSPDGRSAGSSRQHGFSVGQLPCFEKGIPVRDLDDIINQAEIHAAYKKFISKALKGIPLWLNESF